MPAAARFSVRGGGFGRDLISSFPNPIVTQAEEEEDKQKHKENQLSTRINKWERKGKNRVKCGMKAHEVRVTSTTAAAAQHKTLPAYVCV